MDITLQYGPTKAFVDQHGWDALLEAIEHRCGKTLDLYSVSQDWYQDQRYILKCKGGKGDVLVTWA